MCRVVGSLENYNESTSTKTINISRSCNSSNINKNENNKKEEDNDEANDVNGLVAEVRDTEMVTVIKKLTDGLTAGTSTLDS